MATEEITISELELADEVLADMTLPVDTATETRAVTLKQLRAWLGSALPVGSVFASVGRLDDERFTLLDGKTISRIGTYEAFCNKVVEKVQAGTWKACTEEEFNQELSETGQCGKFVVSNDYIRIPKYGNSLYSGVIDGTIPVVGNGMTLGFTNGSLNVGIAGSTAGGSVYNSQKTYGTTIGTNASNSATSLSNLSMGVATDPTKSGLVGQLDVNSVEVFYYMVISTEGQTASVEIDINKVYEDLNIKANTSLSNVASNIDYVVERYNDGTNWYRVYKSGWIEQGGILRNRTEEVKTFNLLKPFADTNYTGNAGICTASAMENNYPTTIYGISGFAPVSTSQACVRTINWNDSSWFACGQGA